MVDIVEILVHWYAGRSQSQIAESLGLDRKTVNYYMDPAVAAGLALVDRSGRRRSGNELVRQWFPHIADTKVRQSTWPEIE